MRKPIVPDPVHRRAARSGPGARSVVALVVLLAVAGLMVALATVALRGLSRMPDGTARETMTAEIAAARERAVAEATRAAPITPTAPDGAASATPPAADGTGPAADSPAGVRYVEGEGIVATRVEGPLTRAPSTVVVPPKEKEGPKPTLYRLVVIEDADTINLRTHRIELAGVTGPDAGATCTTAAGAEWPCGMRARTALRRLVRRRALECLDVPTPPGAPQRATCSAGGTDLSTWLVEQGWARPEDDAPDALKALAAEAEAAGRGLYDPAAR